MKLLKMRAALARPRGYKRIDALLSADDASAAIQALSIRDIHALVHEVGFADCYELMALASPEQVQGCLDLDSWDRDRFELEATRPWLAAVLESGFENFGRVWSALDPELCAMLLARSFRVYDHSLGEEPDDSVDAPIYKTPDTFFSLVAHSERDEDIAFLHRMVEDLYRFDITVARQALMAARSETMAELEEYSYRWRSGRMADIGFTEFYEALEVFRPLDPKHVQPGEDTEDQIAAEAPGAPPMDLPVSMIEQVLGRAFLTRAFDAIDDAETSERLERAVLVLVNKVLSAARVSPSDQDAIAIGTEHAACTLALGLESVSRGDIPRAAHALRTVSLTRLHRVGYTLSLRLGRAAKRLSPHREILGDEGQAVLSALLRGRPFFPCELDNPPKDDIRPFESSQDLQTIAEALARMTFRIALAEAAGIDPSGIAELPEPRPELDDYLRTALARSVAGGEFEAAPLDMAELSKVRDAMHKGRLGDETRRKAAERILGSLPEGQFSVGRQSFPTLLSGWFEDLETDLGTVVGELDPKALGRLVLRADKS